MNRPPPLSRIFAIYFRALLVVALLLTACALALQLGWDPPHPIPGLIP